MHEMPNKIENIIKDLIKKEAFNTQADLVKALAKQGIETKQSTVSRALHRIGAVKRMEPSGGVRYRVVTSAAIGASAYNNNLVHDIRYNEAMVILNTRSGSAGHVAQYLDEQDLPDIMGTLAGDNCILVMPTSIEKIEALAVRLQTLFPNATKI